jgi:hypothetical protein
MRTQHHILPSANLGNQRTLSSLHFGAAVSGKKVYIQSSLHADEIPGMLVAHYLRQQFTEYEHAGAIDGEIVLVPVANPIGLAQDIQGTAFGRFDLSTGINFNRAYRYLTPELIKRLEGQLGHDVAENTQKIRQAARAILAGWQPNSEAEALKKHLQTLAIDADIVLDLHCDNQAVLHMYTGTPLVQQSMPLAAHLGAHAVLVTTESGGDPFDENCSRHWWELAAHFKNQKQDTPVALACLSITVELRGEADVKHDLARKDAAAICAFLQQAGHIKGAAPAMPALLCEATPLEGVDPIVAPHSGIFVLNKAVGDLVQAGESIGEIVDPLTSMVTPLIASTRGTLFACLARRYVSAGTKVAKVAGSHAFRQGMLLSM